MKIEKPKGTRDFAPEEMEARKYIEREIAGMFTRYGFRQIRTPSFEHVELFEKKSGEEISTHMYAFEDKKGRMMCLRPEETASVCRMYAETLRTKQKPLKLYYFDPMFRYEEPQKGRYREFWQMGLELIGPSGPESDAEVISVAYESLKKIGVQNVLEIGHLGVLKGFLEDRNVPEADQRKILACIDKNDIEGLRKLSVEKALYELIGLKGGKEVLAKAEKHLKNCERSMKSLTELRNIIDTLDFLGIEYLINLGIARGLEYYTGMVFEIRVAGLGAQNQICGGGRYDNLIELFSGLSVPAVGFAYGFDRVVEAAQLQKIETPARTIDAVIAPASPEMKKEAFKIAAALRKDYVVDYDLMDRKLGKILEYAAEAKARYVIIVGAKDLALGQVTLRDMTTGEQKIIKIEEIGKALK